MIDRRRRRFDTRLLMTMARRDLLGSKVNVPCKKNRLKSSLPDLKHFRGNWPAPFSPSGYGAAPNKAEYGRMHLAASLANHSGSPFKTLPNPTQPMEKL